MFAAKNPPPGAILNYFLKAAVPPAEAKPAEQKKEATEADKSAEKKDEKQEPKKEGTVKITVTDKDGKVIREVDGPAKAGVNRANWDLRFNAPAEPSPEQLEAIAAGYGFGPRGPYVEPGEFTVKIKAGDKEAVQRVAVEDDPRLQLSPEDGAARRIAIEQLY